MAENEPAEILEKHEGQPAELVTSILRKPAEKRPARGGQISEITEESVKRQRLDKLETVYNELIQANQLFQKKAEDFINLKKSIDFINTPHFLKHRWPRFIF